MCKYKDSLALFRLAFEEVFFGNVPGEKLEELGIIIPGSADEVDANRALTKKLFPKKQ